MTLARLHAILDAYGADPVRWPADEREAALALLARSADARRHHDDAARLDAALDRSPVEAASPPLGARVLRHAPRRRAIRLERLVAIAAPLAAAAALVLWLVRSPAPAPLTADAIAALGTYDTPTDTLLAPTGPDLVDTAPALWCTEGELGCIDLDSPSDDDAAGRHVTGRIRV